MWRLRQAFLLLLPLAGALTAVPVARGKRASATREAHATLENAPAPTKAAVKTAVVRLETLRKSSFETPSFSGEYGFVSFLALQSREAKDERLHELFSAPPATSSFDWLGMICCCEKGVGRGGETGG